MLSQGVLAQWTFSEVMYDPDGTDNDREWVEVFGPPLNENITFIEDGNAHSLTLISGDCNSNECVSIIADNSDLFLIDWEIPANTLLYDSSWSSFKNTGEEIGLKEGDIIIQSFTYEAIAPSPNSLQLINNTWVSKLPSPGIFENTNIENNQSDKNNTSKESEEVIAEVPEFDIILASLMLGVIGIFISLRRKNN